MEEPKIFRPKIWTFYFISNINCLENDKSTKFDVSSYFSNLAENVMSKLPNPSNKYGVWCVQRNVYWNDSDWPAKNIWYDKLQNSAL